MPLYSHKYYQEKAAELVKNLGFMEPPVDVRQIAQYLKIEVVEMTLPAWFSGALLELEGDHYIVLNATKPEAEKVYVIAHEIAHHQLHLDEINYIHNHRNEYNHHLANVYASELCMPSDMVKKEARKWFNDHKFLARIFGITETTMLKKMEDLKLVPTGRFAWMEARG